jgi:hypothetical protein
MSERMRHDQPNIQQRKPWIPLKVEAVGKLTETILGGGGKLSPPFNDPGEPRKPPGMGG